MEIKGSNRYQTSALIADKQNYTTAILVNSTKSIADGLSASALSGAANAPILLVKQNEIPADVELRLECTNKIYIIGSENAISKNIEDRLKKSGFIVSRIGGKNRYETSVNVANEVKRVKGGASETFIVNGVKGEADAMSISSRSGFIVSRIGGKNRYETSVNVGNEVKRVKGGASETFIVNGTKGEADAMSISSVAARDSAPVILTDGKTISADAKKIVNSIPNRYAIGLQGVMNESLVESLGATRVGGKNRFETNKKIINTFYKNVASYYLSKSDQLVDALAASPITIGATRVGGKNRFETNKKIINTFYKNVASYYLSKSDQLVDALAASPITKYSPIVLVNKNSDKSVLKGAQKMTALGGIDKATIESCKKAAQ